MLSMESGVLRLGVGGRGGGGAEKCRHFRCVMFGQAILQISFGRLKARVDQ